ncbi:hypothetical protein JIG36_13660 [Actinoplanes sp. LDG1-06]|uniref:Uncharacterized protein n=1 Tax=Paractinoplanes ovalisporus TaxID=2810368 RepID=A0ABS2A9U1_9ACTN|nr:hypothetical protein [Actinoplanes ovalisporus]MBM2616606.1 hypothetical protein [Actinoplanes ovalisporus]
MTHRWFTRHRYGPPSTVAAFAGLFVALFVFAAFTLVATSNLMSNACTDSSGQVMCPISGADWARPLPAAATLAGLAVTLTGLLLGRPARAPAVIAGFALVTLALIGGLLIGY